MTITDDRSHPTNDDPEMSPRRRRQIHGTIVVAALIVLIAIIWKYGGSGASFKIEATGDPDKRFDWDFFFSLVPDFLEALWITVQATLAGVAVAMVLGLALALGRRSDNRILRWPVASFIEFIRSTPLLIQLYFLFYALPTVGFLPENVRVLSSMTALIMGIGIHYGTYCSEAYRAGIDSVPAGQWEAATAMNLTSTTTWRRVILPQAIPNVLPALGNYLVAGFKDAPLGSSIQVTGVLFFARTVTSSTFRPVEAYTMVGLGFLAVSIPAAFLIRRLERRIGYDR
ncbi:MAG: ectoine/hydroxyectoine ABC transporter permease subunit EhuD [Acidimicrobiales bacterium]